MKRIKHFLAFFGMTFLLVSFSNCGSSQQSKAISFEENPPFTISEIFSQDWVAGVQEGGSGTNVSITLNGLSNEVQIKEIYFRKKKVNATQRPNVKSAYMGYFKNDLVRDVIMDNDPVKESKNTPSAPFPFDLGQNEAVISYVMNGSTKYVRMSNILEKPMIAYPSTNPNGID